MLTGFFSKTFGLSGLLEPYCCFYFHHYVTGAKQVSINFSCLAERCSAALLRGFRNVRRLFGVRTRGQRLNFHFCENCSFKAFLWRRLGRKTTTSGRARHGNINSFARSDADYVFQARANWRLTGCISGDVCLVPPASSSGWIGLSLMITDGVIEMTLIRKQQVGFLSVAATLL